MAPSRLRFSRERLAGLADAFVIAIAVSLPWSTSATGILVAAWAAALFPVVDWSGLRRTIMTRVIYGRDKAQLAARLQGESADEHRANGHLVGTGGEIAEQIQALGAAGVQGVMLQWLDSLDDIEGIEALGRAATTAVR